MSGGRKKERKAANAALLKNIWKKGRSVEDITFWYEERFNIEVISKICSKLIYSELGLNQTSLIIKSLFQRQKV